MKNSPKKVHIRTFGCQMNDRDSEEIIGMLFERGYILSDSQEEADVVLFNTCSVRRHAEDRAISNIGALKRLKERRPQMIIGVIGCMAKAHKEKLLEKLPHVDFICGPANIYEIPEMVSEIINRREGTVPFGSFRDSPLWGQSLLAIDRENRPEIKNIAYHKRGESALVTIMEGCDNFCSYCIVPYVRGREISRPSDEILQEIKCLAENGYKEVTLLGQNVNSYGKHEGTVPFGDSPFVSPFVKLLEEINGIEGIERIRFITSHPKDAGEDLFKAMRDLAKVCKHLHLPLQSGSDKILKAMNRGYTAREFLGKIKLLRKYIPDCAITTDIIVGYPGESEDDFEATKRLMEEIEFNSAYIFKYSPRPPARSSELEDDVPRQVKEERNQILLNLQKRISSRIGGLALLLILFCTQLSGEAKAATVDEYFVNGSYESAAREAGRLLASRTKEADKLYYILGTSLNKLGRYAVARSNFQSLIEKYPRSSYAPLAQLGIADAYYLSADYQNASKSYERYLARYPESESAALAIFRLAKCAQKQGNWRRARNYFQKVKNEYPLSFEAQLATQALSEEILYFTVQVGSFNKKSNALRLCDELTKKGYDASILRSEARGRIFYRVRVGRLNKREDAKKLARRLQAEGLPTNILP